MQRPSSRTFPPSTASRCSYLQTEVSSSPLISSNLSALSSECDLTSCRDHPAANGQVERVNSTSENISAFIAITVPAIWLKLLPLAEFVYNNASHVTTGVSPPADMTRWLPSSQTPKWLISEPNTLLSISKRSTSSFENT